MEMEIRVQRLSLRLQRKTEPASIMMTLSMGPELRNFGLCPGSQICKSRTWV